MPPDGEAFAIAQRTDAFLAFTGDKLFLRSASGRSFVMYQIRGHSWVVMGDPVGDPTEWSDLLWRLREDADIAQGRLLLYQMSLQTLPIAIDLGLQIVKYGEEARVDLAAFTIEGPAAKPLRYAVRRAEREGASVEIVPAAQVQDIMARLHEISDIWLREKGHREKGFSVGRFDPVYMARFDCAVVRQGERIVAFANLWATRDKSELSIDLMRHDLAMPYGTMDYLFASLMGWGRDQGYRWFTLGLAPLSGLEARRLAPDAVPERTYLATREQPRDLARHYEHLVRCGGDRDELAARLLKLEPRPGGAGDGQKVAVFVRVVNERRCGIGGA